MSAPDPSPDSPSATGALKAHPDDASFETDFADLAARFAAQSGGGLSPELSADLALEIVLNEIVEQACVATGATGAAIVLQRDGEMVCRASSGSTAPDLGSRLDTSSGLSGECVRTRQIQRCNDVTEDPHADLEASKRLGIRSVVVMPLLRGEELVGVFELFSSRANAFDEREEGNLEVLAGRAMSNLERASERLEAHSPTLPVPEAFSDIPLDLSEETPRRSFDFVTAVLGVAVLVCLLLLGVLFGRHLGVHAAKAHKRSPAPVVAVATPVGSNPSSQEAAGSHHQSTPSSSVHGATAASVPPGGLLISENGKEVFRMPPAQIPSEPAIEEQGGSVERASSVDPEKIVELSPTAAESSLLRRVEPQYPAAARDGKVQGAVVLDVHIGANGAVQEVEVVSGAPLLTQASTEAVKQWRFKPRAVNGRLAEMETKVTLNFRLPQAN